MSTPKSRSTSQSATSSFDCLLFLRAFCLKSLSEGDIQVISDLLDRGLKTLNRREFRAWRESVSLKISSSKRYPRP